LANPEKYDKSSKAMETIGAVRTVFEMWNKKPTCDMSTVVTDEDGPTRAKLSHSMADLVATNCMTKAKCRYKPKKVGCLGSKKDNVGMLPLDHPEIKKLSDPIDYYVKNYKSDMYLLVKLAKCNSQTCKADALRLSSRNLACMLVQHQPHQPGATFKTFEEAGLSIFEHHWNNHIHCGDWCQAKKWTAKEKEENKNKYRDKVSHAKEYEQQKVVHAKCFATI
jgi:hypothetical protein